MQWHWPLVLLQSGSKPLLTSQLHGPHVGCPHQPRGQGWSILQREARAGVSSLRHPDLVWLYVALLTLAVARPGSQFFEGHVRDRLATEACCCIPDPLTWSHSMAQGSFGDTRRCSHGGHWAFGYTWTGAHKGSGHIHLYSCHHSNLGPEGQEGLSPHLPGTPSSNLPSPAPPTLTTVPALSCRSDVM